MEGKNGKMGRKFLVDGAGVLARAMADPAQKLGGGSAGSSSNQRGTKKQNIIKRVETLKMASLEDRVRGGKKQTNKQKYNLLKRDRENH